MSFPLYRSWWPQLAAHWHISSWFPKAIKIIVNNRTGAPIGLQSQNANGSDGIWGLTPITPAELAAPSALMLQDLAATFQVDVAPYDRYRSDGTQLISLDGEGGTFVPPGINVVWFSPIVVTEGHPIVLEGSARIIE